MYKCLVYSNTLINKHPCESTCVRTCDAYQFRVLGEWTALWLTNLWEGEHDHYDEVVWHWRWGPTCTVEPFLRDTPEMKTPP